MIFEGKETLIVRNGRFILTDNGKDIYYMLNSFAGIKAGTPEAILAYKITSIPRNLKTLIGSVNERRKNNPEFDRFFKGKSTKEVIDNLEAHGFITEYTGNGMREAQLKFLSGILVEPAARANTPDRKIFESLSKHTSDDDYDYILGKKRPENEEELVYSKVYEYYMCNVRKDDKDPYPVPGKALSVKDIAEVILPDMDREKVMKAIYSLANKNMFCIYPEGKGEK